MTVIVASLFLPYTVEFKIDDQIDQNLVKDLTIEKKKLQPQLHQPQPQQPQSKLNKPKLQQSQSQQQVQIQSQQIRPTNSILSRSLTSTSIDVFKTNNSSVEEFFNQGSVVGSPPIISSNEFYNLPNNTNSSSNSFNDELNKRLLNLNRSSSANTFIPKSTVNHSTLLKKSLNDSQISLVKLSKNSKKKQSNLKFEQQQKQQQKQNQLKDQSSETETFIDDNTLTDLNHTSSGDLTDDDDEDDDRFDSLYNHKVPKFGGFSKKNVLSHTNENNELVFKDFDIIPFSKGNGALKTAITTSLNDYKWLGTIGIPTDRLPDQTKNLISKKLSNDFNCESVLPSDSTFQGHYKNFCKQILWPTLHYQIPDNPNSKAFEDHSWDFYKKLNQDFANKIIEIYNKDNNDIIWIHDYHLFLVPKMIRNILPNAKIGFFLHVSFPSSELFKCFAQREYLLEGILASNFISFQTDEYSRHFAQTCNKLLLADITKNEIRYKGSITQIASSPIGIDSKTLTEQFKNSELIKSWKLMIRNRWSNNKKLIIGRDKFDRIRGVKQKLLSYEMFLKNNPKYIENTTLIQICLKSNDHDSKLENEIMTIIDRINSLDQNISSSSQPVVFLHQDIDFIQYLALIAEADCFIVSSMREGMNLTCHEFIVATEFKKSPLIISEFTGSASIFNDNDVFKINPWDLKQFSNAIKSSLELSSSEKEQHWNNLIEVIKNLNCLDWVNFNLEKIQESWKIQKDRESFNYQIFNFEKFHNVYKSINSNIIDIDNNDKKLFILNLSNTFPTDRILKILLDLINDSNNEVYIFSNFKKNEMERYYRVLLPKIGFIAENGGLIKIPTQELTSLTAQSSWISLINPNKFKKWVQNSQKLFKSFEERLPGSFFEIGETFIKFHTESCHDKSLIDPERKSSLIGDLVSHINDFDHEDGESSISRKNSFSTATNDRSNSLPSSRSNSATTLPTGSSSSNISDITDLKIHATLNDIDEIIYIENTDLSTKIIDFLVDYYTNNEVNNTINKSLKNLTDSSTSSFSGYKNQVIDISEYLANSLRLPITPILAGGSWSGSSGDVRTIRNDNKIDENDDDEDEDDDDNDLAITITGTKGLNDYFQGSSNESNDKQDSKLGKIQLLTIAGHRSIFFDSVFDYISEKTDLLKSEEKVENVFTIGYENNATSGNGSGIDGGVKGRAKEYVEGLNDLFTILQQLMK